MQYAEGVLEKTFFKSALQKFREAEALGNPTEMYSLIPKAFEGVMTSLARCAENGKIDEVGTEGRQVAFGKL